MSTHPGYEKLVSELSGLISTYPPSFIYINDSTTPRITANVVKSILKDNNASIRYAHMDGVACFTPRLLYDSVINALAGWKPKWNDGCVNWDGSATEDGGSGSGSGQRWNDNLDAFLHGLRAVRDSAVKQLGKGKEKAKESDIDIRLVISIERAERLKENLPELFVPLTRLAELSQADLTVIMISDVRWEDIRPSLGASPDPYYIDVAPPTKDSIIQRQREAFITTSNTQSSQIYHPALLSLYTHFISTLVDICFPSTHDPHEHAYIAAARWPGFVQPVLDAYKLAKDEDPDLEFTPPTEDIRMRLIRLFTPSMDNALESLYPRLTNASDWAKANVPDYDILTKSYTYSIPSASRVDQDLNDGGMDDLPIMSKYILVAAFLASTNPAKSDLRMFGRGLDEKKRKRRGPIKRTARSGPAKVPQRLLGPTPFPLDRLIAMLGALLEENDVDDRPPAPVFKIPGEYTDMEIRRVGVYASIMELTSMRLLHRTSPADRLDGPPMFKCGVSYDVALALARDLGVPLNDLMWDPA